MIYESDARIMPPNGKDDTEGIAVTPALIPYSSTC